MRNLAVTEIRYSRLLWLAVALSALAGMVHLFVSSQYLRQWLGYGYFFIWAGLLQLVFAFAIFLMPWLYAAPDAPDERRRSVMRGVYLLGVAGNAAIIALYVVTRTSGVPFVGPAANVVLPVTPLSLAVTLAELALVVILLILARQRLPEGTERRERATA